MLIAPAQRVRPLDEFFELIYRPTPTHPNKEVAMSLTEGSLICLCDAPEHQEPKVLRTYRFEQLRHIPHQVLLNDIRWTITNDIGQIWEGSTEAVDLYRGLFIGQPDLPIRSRRTKHGRQVVFKFQLPSCYRVHYLAYLQKRYPKVVRRLAA